VASISGNSARVFHFNGGFHFNSVFQFNCMPVTLT